MRVFKIDGYWKDKGPQEGFYGYLVTSEEGCPAGLRNSDIFFHGLDETALERAVEKGKDFEEDFVVTAWRPYEIPGEFHQRINDNALIGYKCPRCASQGPFEMTTICKMPWEDEGTDFAGEPEIVPEGWSTCSECGYNGKTEEFDAEKHYVNRGGNHCPYCNSENISGGTFQMDDAGGWREASCLNCGAEWQDVFKLIGIDNFPDHDFIRKHNEELEEEEEVTMPCPECFEGRVKAGIAEVGTEQVCPECEQEFKVIDVRTVRYTDE